VTLATKGNVPARPAWHRRASHRFSMRRLQQGRWGYILAWLLGVPIPILIVVYLLRGCT
jgi:hypothetical protein